MNKQETENAINVMQAFADGKTVEVRSNGSEEGWIPINNPSWNWRHKEYRIKPGVEPIDEFLKELKVYGPYIKDVEKEEYFIPTRITGSGVIHRSISLTYNTLHNSDLYTWAGGEGIL